MKPGEEALCRNCGAYVKVPETSVEVDEEFEPEKTVRRNTAEAGAENGESVGWFDHYRGPACSGTNLGMAFFDFYLGLTIPGRRYILECNDCGERFMVKQPV